MPSLPRRRIITAIASGCASAFTAPEPDALSDYELLEMALFRALPRQDTKPLAKSLLSKFGSFAEVVHAPVARLREVEGIGDASVTRSSCSRPPRAGSAKARSSAALSCLPGTTLIDYCRSSMAFADKEQFRLLFLDKRNQLIADEVQQTGTVDHTPVYPREVIKRALELSATALILVHNHPSGDPTPSQADIQMTKAIVDIAAPARHLRARPHHRRQERPCQFEGDAADLAASIKSCRRTLASDGARSKF